MGNGGRHDAGRERPCLTNAQRRRPIGQIGVRNAKARRRLLVGEIPGAIERGEEVDLERRVRSPVAIADLGTAKAEGESRVTHVTAMPPTSKLRLNELGLLSIGERPEFQALGQDRAFGDLRLQQSSLREVLANPSVDAIMKNSELVSLVWSTTAPDLKDLEAYLRTLKSEKYASEEILGRWSFDLAASMLAYRRDKPGLAVNDVPKIRRWMEDRFGKISFVAAPDKLAVLKQFPLPPTATNPNPGTTELKGTWRNDSGDYFLTFPGEEERKARISQGKLSFKTEGVTIILIPES